MRRILLNIILFLSSTILSVGQNVKVSSSFDTSRIYLGDQINFIVTIQQPPEINLTLPLFKDSLMKNIEILSGPVYDSTESADGMLNIVEKYLITSFDSGYYQVPPVYAELKNEDGIKRFYSDYSQLEVMRIKIAPQDSTSKIFDIIGPYRAPLTLGEIIPWVLLLAIVATLIWIGLKILRRLRRKEADIEEIIIKEPAHIIAFRELDKLKEEQLWQKGETKQYYTRLTEILRMYLENRFRIFSLELTTAETLEALVKAGFKKDNKYNQLKTVLTGADLVKFAKHNPVALENDSHFQNSWDFIQTTKEEDIISGGVSESMKDMEGKK